VIAIGLFEHLTNPLNFLKESYRVLKRNGKLIIITDNAGFWGVFGVTHHGGYEKRRKKDGFLEDKHYSLFTPNHLINWLEHVGFREIKVEYFINRRWIKKHHYLFFQIYRFCSSHDFIGNISNIELESI